MNELYYEIDSTLKLLVKNFIEIRNYTIENLKLFSDYIMKLYDLVYEYYVFFEQNECEHYISSRINTLGPIIYFEDLLNKVREELWFKLIENYDYIFKPVNCYRNNTKIIPSDLLFLIISLCNVCLLHECFNEEKDIFDEGKSLNEISAFDLPYARKNLIVKTLTPIVKMTVFELVDSIHQLSYRWNNLFYDKELVKYVEILEYRSSIILVKSHGPDVHNITEYRKQIKNNIFIYNEILLNILSSHFIGFRIRLSNYKIRNHVPCPESLLPTEEKCEKLLEWLKTLAIRSFGDHIYTRFRILYLPNIITPGEKEEYIRKRPSDVISFQKIYRYVRGDQAADKILEFSSKRDANIILDDDESIYPNSMSTMSFILLNSLFNGMFGLNFARYIIFRDEIKYRHMEFDKNIDPMIVQSFNHFNVYYNDEIYELNSFKKSFIVFLNIIEKLHNVKIEENTLDAHKLFTTLFGEHYFIDQNNNNNNNNNTPIEFDEYEIFNNNNNEDSDSDDFFCSDNGINKSQINEIFKSSNSNLEIFDFDDSDESDELEEILI
jgi:hypothetical protein